MVQLHKFSCPCGYTISASTMLLGKDINCPQCNLSLKLPKPLDKTFSKTNQQKHVCGYCGHINTATESTCQYCGEILLLSAGLTAQKVQKKILQPPSPQSEDKTGEKKRYIELFITAVIFILGFIIGVMLCPGYWNILPPGYKLLPFVFTN